MQITPIKFIFLSTASVLFLASCGGGGSSSSSAPPPSNIAPPPAPVSGIVSGPISGFGSVIVNGERYNTNAASFVIEGKTGVQADLRVGQIVTMKTSTDSDGNKSASEVSFEDMVQGPITNISLVNNRFTVLGQTVVVRASTSFDEDISPSSLDGLMLDDIVQVSGQINGGGNIIASQIELKDSGEEFELTGTVSALNSGLNTFRIRGQVIDYTSATLSDFGNDTLSNGDFVEVYGTSFEGDVFVADKIELEDRMPDGNNEDDGEIQGLITEFTSAQNFVVADIAVISDSATIFENCQASDLTVDIDVEVEGHFNETGVLEADKIKCEFEADLEVESTVDAVDADAGTITVFGVTFSADQSTRFDDKSSADITSFGLGDIAVGDFVEVKGFERTDMSLYAVKIDREDAEDESSVQGPVETVGATSLSILGIEIETNTETEYESADDTVLSQAEFFGQVIVGDLVAAKGQKTGETSLLASEIEFEAED